MTEDLECDTKARRGRVSPEEEEEVDLRRVSVDIIVPERGT